MAGLAELSHKAQRAAASVIIDHVLSNAKKDREKAFLDIVDFAEKFWGDGMPKEDYDKVREAIRHPEGNKWIRFINRVLDETNKGVTDPTHLDYTAPLLMLAGLGVAALLIGLVLKVVDKKKGIGLEEPNIKA